MYNVRKRKCQYQLNFWIQDGSIGADLVIRPLPDRVLNEVISKRDELHQPHLLPNLTRKKRDLDQASHHIVFKRSNGPEDLEYSDFGKFFTYCYFIFKFKCIIETNFYFSLHGARSRVEKVQKQKIYYWKQ